MAIRTVNLVLASGLTLLLAGAAAEEPWQWHIGTVVPIAVAVVWLAGAIGLFFRSHLAWCGSLLGVGTILAVSLGFLCDGWLIEPDVRPEATYSVTLGILGLLVSLPLLARLLPLRKTCVSQP
jgi:hypothetical protein